MSLSFPENVINFILFFIHHFAAFNIFNDLPEEEIKTTSNKNSVYNDDNYVEMSLHKNLGFSVNYGYKLKSNYKDENLFNELQPILTQRLKEINANNFNEIWGDLMKESGILRDSNLDDILNG